MPPRNQPMVGWHSKIKVAPAHTHQPMKAREYEITISLTGEVEIHVEGFQGKGCVEAIRFFEQMIGQTQELRHTSGYYEPDEDVTLHNQQRH